LEINADNLEIGNNSITVWAGTGLCSQAALSQTPVITKIKTAEITSVTGGIICNEGTGSLIAVGAEEGLYNWYDAVDSSQPIADQHSGVFVTPSLTKTKTYYVASVNSLGCEGERVPVKAVVSYPDNISLTLLDATTFKSSHVTGIQWYLNDNLIADANSDVLSATEPGIYTLTVNQGGCITSTSREISEIAFEGGTNVESFIKIYPNPTQNKVYIQVRSRNEIVKAVILSSTGVEMESKNLAGDNGIKEGEFDMLPYATGIYNIRIIDGSKLLIKKIAKVN
jgi:hypothetical protein